MSFTGLYRLTLWLAWFCKVRELGLIIRELGLKDYAEVYEAMQTFTQTRDEATSDELWLVEHPPVFTLGQAGDPSHLLNHSSNIPVVKVDRGGQITYHGPGQVVIYLLLDLRRKSYFVRELVNRLEQAIIDTLSDFGVFGARKDGAPGIYLTADNPGFEGIAGAKIAALGLKISKHCCYHGLALNVKMDLSPFESINPCGYAGLRTADLYSLGVSENIKDIEKMLVSHLKSRLELT